MADERGLSPRVRGSLIARASFNKSARSIPAGAGEPDRTRLFQQVRKVYPRGCGGALHTRLWQGALFGLSPRVRGAPVSRAANTPSLGLSPRVRGSRQPSCECNAGVGSIPAGAGEP